MNDFLLSILYLWKNLTLKDILDIFLTFIFNFLIIYFVFRTYIWRIFFLVSILILVSYTIKLFNLTLSNIYFTYFLSFGVLIIIIIFQKEIRRFIENFDISFFKKSKIFKNELIIEEIIRALKYFSENKIGCLLVFKNKEELKDKVHDGIILNSNISAELLISIFQKNSPLHDGAVIIEKDKIKLASVVLPLSHKFLNKNKIGTRHRAGLGITEESDAFSIIVSEETGKISFAENKEINFDVSLNFIEEKLLNYYLKNNKNEKNILRKIFDVKVALSSLIIALIFSFSFWTLINYQKVKIQKIVYLPVNFKNLKEGYYISYLSSEKIKTVISGYNYDLNRIKEDELQFIFDLKDLDVGNHVLLVKEAIANIPSNIKILTTEPEVIKLKISLKNEE